MLCSVNPPSAGIGSFTLSASLPSMGQAQSVENLPVDFSVAVFGPELCLALSSQDQAQGTCYLST